MKGDEMKTIGSLCFLAFIACAIAFTAFKTVVYCLRLIQGEIKVTVGGTILILLYLGSCTLGSFLCIHFARAWWKEFNQK
jgi:hypothetical protein